MIKVHRLYTEYEKPDGAPSGFSLPPENISPE